MFRCTACLILSLAPAGLWAQESGRIRGIVRDESGAALAETSVTLMGGAWRRASTASDGAYLFDGLPSGGYRVVVRRAGFQTQERDGIMLAAAAERELSFTLRLALRGEETTVSASRTETAVVDAPATVSIISSRAIALSAGQGLTDVLRTVPGLNVIQSSARDVNLTGREATVPLANSDLVLLDGRPLNLDFYGHVLWDLVPTHPSDISQIEVIRGPASVVWGAGALTGVVSIVTTSPREAPGGRLTASATAFERGCERCSRTGTGTAYDLSGSFAGVRNEAWSYRVSAALFGSDPLSRPVGRIPVIPDPRREHAQCDSASGRGECVGGAVYPADSGAAAFGTGFENTGTRQPKVDLRLDQQLGSGGRLTYTAGLAGTEGMIHTGLGPYDIQRGTYLGYSRVHYARGDSHASLWVNVLDGDGKNQLTYDPIEKGPVRLHFGTQTYDLEAGDSRVIGSRHLLTYGGNVRRNRFDISQAPDARDRTEIGGYVQDEVFFGRFRLNAGARLDKFGNLDQPVLSPRVAAIFKPVRAHAIRLSYSRAFRSPSPINNSLDAVIALPIDLSWLTAFDPRLAPAVGAPFLLQVRSVGSDRPVGGRPQARLREESLTAYELAYNGTFDRRVTVGLAAYVNGRDDTIRFVALPPDADPYTAAEPPPGWTERGLPVGLLGALAALPPALGGPVVFPRTAFTYLNLGPTRSSGFEASVDAAFTTAWSAFANYSWQGRPHILDPEPGRVRFPVDELGLPPTHRFNLGTYFESRSLFGAVSLSHTSRAFWSEVLTPAFFGYTAAYTSLDATVGLKWNGGKTRAALKARNLTNATIQQEVFGDLFKRSVGAQLTLAF